MPPVRSTKTEYRIKLYERVKLKGIEMPACSRCLKDARRICKVSSDSDRCAECIRAGGNVKCDVWGPSARDWARLEKTENQLDADLEAARAEQQKMFDRLSEISAKIMRIEKQRKMFRARAADMLRRGLRSMDELEAAEEAERVAAEKEGSLEASTFSEPIDLTDPELDPSLVAALSDYDPSNPFWASLGFDDGIPSVPQGT
jgi:hypothetical protein